MAEKGSLHDAKPSSEATGSLRDTGGPDTEPSSPPTPIPPTQSISGDVPQASLKQIKGEGETRSSTLTKTQASPQFKSQDESQGKGSKDGDKLLSDSGSGFSPVSGGVSSSQVAGHRNERRASDGSNTTLQSMMRPELTHNSGVPHTRRFLSIERELEQSSASIKLLEKRLRRLRKEARFASIVGGLALLLTLVFAGLAFLLVVRS